MKKLLVLVTLIITVTVQCQTVFYTQFSIDPKMAFEGSKSTLSEGSSFNFEVSIGFEEKYSSDIGFRVSHRYEKHSAIYYQKVTWVSLDFVLYNRLLWFEIDNFNQYAGLEVSSIYRNIPNQRNLNSFLNPGVNFELQYMFTNKLGVQFNYNYFRAENELIKDGKNFRSDFMLGMIFKLNN